MHMRIDNFIFDLDGTLLDSHSEIPEENVEVIKKLILLDKNIYLCSGRHYKDILQIIKKANLKRKHFKIIFSGGFIYRYKDNEDQKIDSDFISNIQSIQGFTFHTKKGVYRYSKKSKICIRLKNFIKFAIRRYNFETNNPLKLDVLKISYISDNCNFPSISHLNCNFFINKNELEILSKNVSKLNALKKLKINLSNSIYFGDSENDIPAMKECGFSVSMLNSDEKTKIVSQDITLFDNNNGGIARYLNDKILSRI